MAKKLKRIAGLFHDIFNREVNIDSFKDRLLLQKVVFIAQEMVGGIKFKFNPYLHGPYSPSLASDGYAIRDNSISPSGGQFSTTEQRSIEKIKEVLQEEIENEDSDLFQLNATVLYCMRKGLSDDQVINYIQKVKSWYPVNQIQNAITKMRQLMLPA